MQKEELAKIAKLSDLKKYEAGKEYVKILRECDFEENQAKGEVILMYEQKVPKNNDFDFHDKKWEWAKFLEKKLEQITDKCKGAEALKKEIQGDIDFTYNMLTGNVMDKYNNVYSMVRLNNYDMKRLKASHNRLFKQILQGLINTLDIPKIKKEDPVYGD